MSVDTDGRNFNQHVNSLDSSSMLSPSSKQCSETSIFTRIKDMKRIDDVLPFHSTVPTMKKVIIHRLILGVKEMNDLISKVDQECLRKMSSPCDHKLMEKSRITMHKIN